MITENINNPAPSSNLPVFAEMSYPVETALLVPQPLPSMQPLQAETLPVQEEIITEKPPVEYEYVFDGKEDDDEANDEAAATSPQPSNHVRM